MHPEMVLGLQQGEWNVLIIHRQGRGNYEYAVRITDGQRRQWYVDPVHEVRLATDASLFRHDCIMSFADGLIMAGHQVMFDDRRRDRLPTIFEHHRRLTTIPVFFFVGLAWGNDAWNSLKESLRKYITVSERFRVLEHTALYYFNRPGCRSDNISLQLP